MFWLICPLNSFLPQNLRSLILSDRFCYELSYLEARRLVVAVLDLDD